MATLLSPAEPSPGLAYGVNSLTPTALGIVTIASPPNIGSSGGGGGELVVPPSSWGHIG
jgi:hypothetical protein